MYFGAAAMVGCSGRVLSLRRLSVLSKEVHIAHLLSSVYFHSDVFMICDTRTQRVYDARTRTPEYPYNPRARTPAY